MKKKNIYVLFLGVITWLPFLSQNNKIDSLITTLEKNLPDTVRYKTLLTLGNYHQETDPAKAIAYHAQAKAAAEKMNDQLRKGEILNELGWDNYITGNMDKAGALYDEARLVSENFLKNSDDKSTFQKAKRLNAAVLCNIGVLYYDKGDYPKGIEYYEKAAEINNEIGNKDGQAANFGNMGLIYREQGNCPKAIEYYFKALKLSRDMKSRSGESTYLGNIGLVYLDQNDYQKALEYLFAAAKINKEIGHREGLAVNFINIGLVYSDKSDYPKALNYYEKALKLFEQLDNKKGIAINLGNIGLVYLGQGDSAFVKGNKELANSKYAKALEYSFSSLEMNKELGSKLHEASNLINIGSIYIKQKKYAKAEEFLKNAYFISQEISALESIEHANQLLSTLYEASNKPDLALKHFKLYVQYRDTIENDENTRKIIQQEFKYNYEKKFAADSVAFAKEKKIKESEIAKQQAELKAKRNQQYALFGGLGLVIIFSGFMYNRFQVTKRQKRIIEKQKHLVEEKQKEILDSIHYAKRIQKSLLPNDKYFSKNLNR